MLHLNIVYTNKVNGQSMFYGARASTFAAARNLRKNMTLHELILWKKLRDKTLFKIKFRRQHPIDFYIVDFYNHDFRLVIEVDGEIHETLKAQEYDERRTRHLQKFGITVLRFTNYEIISDINSVIHQINKTITDSSPL